MTHDGGGDQRKQLSEVIADYLQAVQAGREPDRDKLLAEHPELAAELQKFLSMHGRMEAAVPPEPPTLPPSVAHEDEATLPPEPRAEKPTLGPAPANSSAALSTSVRYFGDYELLEEIARGGMGVVYKARQTSLNRIVALKMILSGQLAGEEEVKRFYVEAEAAAKLDHPNIVPIYEIGEHDGQHYFSMGFVPGCSLADLVAAGPLEQREAARLVQVVSEAIAYAHSKGVIHRDLKPANILLAQGNEDDARADLPSSQANRRRDSAMANELSPARQVQHIPKVTDFGLAKRFEDDRGMTATGQILGTPSYMPPEQAAGKQTEVRETSDVYSLGAILYCLLTGRPPFQCNSVVDTLLEAIDKDPAPPRLLNGRIDRDLELICLKCLEKEARRRYPSATDLARDLAAYLEGEPISISSVNLVHTLGRALARSKYDAAFASWGAMLLWFALVVLSAEVGTYLLSFQDEFDPLKHALPIRVVQFLLMGAVAWSYRKDWMNRGAIERQMWAIWLGFLIACHLAVFVCGVMLPEDERFHYFACYPFFAMLSGFMFFIFGGSHWGGCFVVGAMFFGLTLLMPFHLQLAPLGFGLLWGASLALIGWRLQTLPIKTAP